MKRLLALLCALAVVFTLTSCRSSAPGKTLSVWVMGEAGEQLESLLSVFRQENPDVKVDVQAIPWGQAHEKLMTAAAGGTLPDVFQCGTTWMSQFYALGVFEPLKPYIEKSEVIKEDKFFPGSWATNVFAGGAYGIPWYADTRILFYRRDIVESLGVQKIPEEWEDFQDMARKLVKIGPKGEVTRSGLDIRSAGIFFFLSALWQNGAEVLNSQNQPQMEQPAALEAVEYYRRFFTDKVAPLTGLQGTELVKAFEAGTLVMFVGGPWSVEEINRYAPAVLKLTATSILPGKKRRTSFIGGSNMVIYKNSAHKADAWKFVEFLSRPDTQMSWYQLAKALPATYEAWEDERFQSNPILRTFGEQMRDAQSPPNIPQWEEISGEILINLEKLIYGKMTTKDFAQAVNTKVLEILQRK